MLKAKMRNLALLLAPHGVPAHTQARRRYAALEPDRTAQARALRKAAPNRFDRKRLDATIRLRTFVPNLDRLWLSTISKPIVTALRTQFASQLRRDPKLIHFGTTLEDDVVASASALEDGSGLVLMSDSLLSLCGYLAELNTFWHRYCHTAVAEGEDRPDAELINAFQRTDGSDAAIVCVRYWILHQRLFGLSGRLATRVTRDEQDSAQRLASAAHTFILAHEAAHFVLGHKAKAHSLLTSQSLPVADDSLVCEQEADTLAIEVARVALEGAFGPMASTMALAGAMVALAAVSIVERGLFLRLACSHPAVSKRRDLVTASYDRVERYKAASLVLGATWAAEYGEDIRTPLGEAWRRSATAPASLDSYLGRDYVTSIRHCDEIHGASRAKLASLLTSSDPDFRLPAAASAVLEGEFELGDVCDVWRVDETYAALIANDRRALNFFTLLCAIKESPVGEEIVDDTARLMVGLAAALVIQDRCFSAPAVHT